jgi:hypothetical protein
MIPKVGHEFSSRIIPPAQGTSLPDKVDDGLGVSLQDDVGLPMYLVHHFELHTTVFFFPGRRLGMNGSIARSCRSCWHDCDLSSGRHIILISFVKYTARSHCIVQSRGQLLLLPCAKI